MGQALVTFPLPGHDRWLTSVLSMEQPTRQGSRCYLPQILAFTLVMLVWGVASEALREIITSFLDQVRLD